MSKLSALVEGIIKAIVAIFAAIFGVIGVCLRVLGDGLNRAGAEARAESRAADEEAAAQAEAAAAPALSHAERESSAALRQAMRAVRPSMGSAAQAYARRRLDPNSRQLTHDHLLMLSGYDTAWLDSLDHEQLQRVWTDSVAHVELHMVGKRLIPGLPLVDRGWMSPERRQAGERRDNENRSRREYLEMLEEDGLATDAHRQVYAPVI